MKDRIVPYLRGDGPPTRPPRPEECTPLVRCDQCGKRGRLHLCGNRAFCSRCCPACARQAAIIAGGRVLTNGQTKVARVSN